MDKVFTSSWYVLHTKSRFENVVNDGLTKKGIEAFLPKISVKSKRKDRNLMLKMPLFPGYIFVKTDLNHLKHIEVLKTAGVVRFIGNNDGPVSVPDVDIDSLKIVTKVGSNILTGFSFNKGDRVIVTKGLFAGVTGTFGRYEGKGRVVVFIEAIGQYAGAHVDEDDIEKLPEILT